jgi:hypothetical protein
MNNNLGPVPSTVERARVTYETIIADNESPVRSGRRDRHPLQAEEGLGWTFGEDFADGAWRTRESAHQAFETQIAGQANGRSVLGSGRQIPAWDAVGGAQLAAFAQASGGEVGRGPRQAVGQWSGSTTRDGQIVQPPRPVDVTERGQLAYGRTVVPGRPGGEGGRVVRPNRAEVRNN